MQNLEKTNERFLRYVFKDGRTHGRTRGRTDGQGRLLRTPTDKPRVQNIFDLEITIDRVYPIQMSSHSYCCITTATMYNKVSKKMFSY